MKRIGKDDFKLLKVIGRGSYGKVYLVERLNDDHQNFEMVLNATQDQTKSFLKSSNHSNLMNQTGKSHLGGSKQYFAMKAMKKK